MTTQLKNSITIFPLLLIFLFQIQASMGILLKYPNSTQKDFDFITGIQSALIQEKNVPVKAGGGVGVGEEGNVDTNAKIQRILKSLNEPKGRLGQACSFEAWEKYMRPTISHTIEGKAGRERAVRAYKAFATAAISNESLVERVCLSKFYALQCEREREVCECLYLEVEETQVQNVECSGANSIRNNLRRLLVLSPALTSYLINVYLVSLI
jgi:hypothetical protein